MDAMMKNTHPMIRSLLRAVLLCAASSAGLVLLPR